MEYSIERKRSAPVQLPIGPLKRPRIDSTDEDEKSKSYATPINTSKPKTVIELPAGFFEISQPPPVENEELDEQMLEEQQPVEKGIGIVRDGQKSVDFEEIEREEQELNLKPSVQVTIHLPQSTNRQLFSILLY